MVPATDRAPAAADRTVKRVAALYDIHSNLPALEAVIEEIRAAAVDVVVIGGDVVPGPMPAETVAFLGHLDLSLRFLRGNGDREVLARMRGIETGTVPERFRGVMDWVAGQLPPASQPLLDSWPPTLALSIAGLGRVLFCHATPRSDSEVFTRETPESRLAPVLADVEERLLVCGHTHMQFDRTVGSIRVVNAGSVGMPFGPPGADWLLLGPEIELRHTGYDLEAAAARIRATRYPEAEEFATGNILDPPSAADMLAAFARVQL
jgi:predicted phosphodiesterase